MIAAVLAMLAAEGALITFVIGNRIVHWHFYLLAVLAFLAFALSIYSGGSGLHASREAVFRGRWSLETGTGPFARQTYSAILGICLLLVLFISGLSGPPKEKVEDKLTRLSEQIDTLATDVNKLQIEIKSLSTGPGEHPKIQRAKSQADR